MTREEAIAFFEDMNECTYGNLEAVKMAIEALELVTSYEGTINKLTEALNQQKEGHWKRIGYDIYECSICGKNVQTGDICAYKHCHGCGARMKGGD